MPSYDGFLKSSNIPDEEKIVLIKLLRDNCANKQQYEKAINSYTLEDMEPFTLNKICAVLNADSYKYEGFMDGWKELIYSESSLKNWLETILPTLEPMEILMIRLQKFIHKSNLKDYLTSCTNHIQSAREKLNQGSLAQAATSPEKIIKELRNLVARGNISTAEDIAKKFIEDFDYKTLIKAYFEGKLTFNKHSISPITYVDGKYEVDSATYLQLVYEALQLEEAFIKADLPCDMTLYASSSQDDFLNSIIESDDKEKAKSIFNTKSSDSKSLNLKCKFTGIFATTTDEGFAQKIKSNNKHDVFLTIKAKKGSPFTMNFSQSGIQTLFYKNPVLFKDKSFVITAITFDKNGNINATLKT